MFAMALSHQYEMINVFYSRMVVSRVNKTHRHPLFIVMIIAVQHRKGK
jgi:hypothetical protein